MYSSRFSFFIMSLFMMFSTTGVGCSKKPHNSTPTDTIEVPPTFISPNNNNTNNIKLGNRFQIDVSQYKEPRQFPFLYKFGNKIFVSLSEHSDGYLISPVDAMIISDDNGKTWGKKINNPDFYLTSMFKEGNTIYGISYITYPTSSYKKAKMIYWTSDDDGETWQKHEGIVKAPEGREFKHNGPGGKWASLLFHRGMMVMEDGSIQGPMYGGGYEGDTKGSIVWVKSADNCKTWEYVSTVAQGYTEPNIIRVKDGTLLCVMRDNSNKPIYQCRSQDNGYTWSSPVPLRGRSFEEAQSVDPALLLMDNGILALSYGRPGTKIVFATDGSGYKWDYYFPTYQGVTSGYSGIVQIGPQKLLLVTDQGANWDANLTQTAIWGRSIDVNIAPKD